MSSNDSVPALPYPLHPHEIERLVSLCGLAPCQKGREPLFDRASEQAAALCGAAFGFVSLLGGETQSFLGASGFEPSDVAREDSFCALTVLQSEPLVVEDTARDQRFARLPPVAGPPFVRFYAGAPVLDATGLPVGSICVLDTVPCTLSGRRLFLLQRLAAMVSTVLEARRALTEALGGLGPNALARAIARQDLAYLSLFDERNGFRALGNQRAQLSR